MSAAHYKLDNLTVIIDNNGLQIDGSNDEVMSLGNLPAKLKAFGFDLYEISGHDLDAIEAALAAPHTPDVPKCILAHTVKGKGVSFMENQVGWHGKAPNQAEYEQAMAELTAQLKELVKRWQNCRKKQQEKAMVRHFVISQKNTRNWLFWMLTWLPQPKPASSRKHIRSVSSTAALPRQI